MSYVVYADVMLVWIFIINYLSYYITCKITNHQLSQTKLIIWSLISSTILELVYISLIYTNKDLLKILYIIINIILYIIFLKFITNKNCIKQTIKMFCYITIVTLMLAGIFIIFNKEIPKIKMLLPIILIICLLFPLALKLCDTNTTKNLYQVEIHTKHQVIKTYGYLDTGNTLIDIYSKKPVIILDYRVIKEILSEKDEVCLEKYVSTGNYQHIASLLIDNERLHPICYKTISNEFSIFPAFKIEYLILNKKIIHKNIIAAISQNKLSNSNDYMVLLNNNL